MRFFAGMHVPRCHVNTTLCNTIFSREYQLFACWLKMFFWIRVEKSMLSVHLVLEICGLKVVVSFNFAPSAPHVKRRVKSCEPRAAAATVGPCWGELAELSPVTIFVYPSQYFGNSYATYQCFHCWPPEIAYAPDAAPSHFLNQSCN